MAATEKAPTGVKSIVYSRNQHIINLRSTRMLMGHGFLARIFDIFGRHRIVVNMVSTSEVTVSVTTDCDSNLDAAAVDLRAFADVVIEKDRAIVCVVGEGLRNTPGIAGDIFQAIKDAGVNVLMISQGASKINVAFVIENSDAEKAVQALHGRFFSGRPGAKQRAGVGPRTTS
ncbi:MAG: ACT domain-containing protein [Planctomycetota bacterium]